MFRLPTVPLLIVLSLSSWCCFLPSTSAFVVRQQLSQQTQQQNDCSRLSMVAIDTSDIKNGLTVELEGEPHKVLSFSIMKQARGAAKTTIKFKNLMRGTTIENTYRSGEKFQTALIEKSEAQFTYNEGINYYFMDMTTFDEIAVSETIVGDKAKWITEGSQIQLISYQDKVIEVVPPSPAIYEVIETEPNVKGNTAQGYTKPATLDCGATISVPGFVESGQKIRVDTDKGEYMERVQSK